LEGKSVALVRLQQRAAQRGGVPHQQRVALTDGAEALQEQMLAHFPEHTLVLDIVSVQFPSKRAKCGRRWSLTTSRC
jgi:hypothetical protein